MASVRKRTWTHKGVTNESWVVSYTDLDGKRRLRTFEKKKDADAFRTKVEGEIADGMHTASSATKTLGEALDAMLEDCKRRWSVGDMAAQTLYSYQAKRKTIPDAISRIKLTEVTSLRIEEYANDLMKTLKRLTVVDTISLISLAMKFAVRRKWIRYNPLVQDRVRIIGPKTAEKVMPSKQQIRALVQTLVDYQRPKRGRLRSEEIRALMVMLGIFVGLRRGEMCGLQWEDVDFGNDMIRVRHSFCWIDKLKSTKTRAGNRNIPMPEPVKRVLLEIRARREGSDLAASPFVMLGNWGQPVLPNKLGHLYWVPLMQDAGLVDENKKPLFTLHALRHAFVSLLIEQGMKPIVVARLAGHADIETTLNTYSHIFPEDQSGKDAVALISGEFFDATTTRQELITY